MSAVIDFPLGRIRPVAKEGHAGSAEVIIFPGVRIERLAFDPAESLPAYRTGSASKTQPRDYDFC